MTNVLLIVVYFGVLLALTKPLGMYITGSSAASEHSCRRCSRPVERGIYRLTGVDEAHEMRWTAYLAALLLFNLLGFLVVYLLQRLQGGLPFNPQGLPGVESGLLLQYRRLVHDQHELAGVLPRDHHELLDANDGAHGPELRLRRDRHRHRHRPDPRLRAPLYAGCRATSGSTSRG